MDGGKEKDQEQRQLPNIIVPIDGDFETLFADVATYFQDYSPITAYAHVLDPNTYKKISREPFGVLLSFGIEPWHDFQWRIWIALVLSEVIGGAYAVGGDEEVISYSVCRRSLAFALARTAFLHRRVELEVVAAKWIHLRDLAGMEPLMAAPEVITWIAELIQDKNSSEVRVGLEGVHSDIQRLVTGSLPLHEFAKTLDRLYPRIRDVRGGLSEHFDGRVPAFERVAEIISESGHGNEIDSLAIAFFANLILPGSLTHTRLLSRRANRYPSAFVWYGFFAAVSNEFDYRGAFSGLGAKLRRDIEANFELGARPVADIAFEELQVLSRTGRNPRTIKPAQARSVLVSLLPGVDVFARFPAPRIEGTKDDIADVSSALAERDRRIRTLLQEAQRLMSEGTAGQRSDYSSAPKRTRRPRTSRREYEE